MKKKEVTISIDGQTSAQETILIGLPNTTSETEQGLFDKELFLSISDNIEKKNDSPKVNQ